MSTRFETGDPTAFGATVLADGRVRFRLWAPAHDSMSVVIGDDPETLEMVSGGSGWFELTTDRAGVGDTYRYQLPDGFRVPDPASRGQVDDCHGPSMVVDPTAYRWRTDSWQGRPWHETVLVELHVGTVTPAGTFSGLAERLDHYRRLGITAVELMPVADFPGNRNWGYDGVLPFAPDGCYGTPDDLRALVDAAHGHGLMVFLDVVYNHFGPDGNYLHTYAPAFFTDRHETPWGAAIDFSQRAVRDFFIANAVHWIEDYRIDGLRFDAVHAIADDSDTHILVELARTVRQRLPAGRHVHLVLENDANEARFLSQEPGGYIGQWNDDYHHVQHVLLTGESDGYYEDYADDPSRRLGRTLTTGFVYQGEPSRHRGGELRGEPSDHLPPTAFVNFLQNHDQIGNRAFGDRLTTLTEPAAIDAALAILLPAPQIPMLYMGEEWGATEPFPFFCDFHDELADAVREGRRREFARFERFADPEARALIPDPNAEATAASARLNWPDGDPEAARRLDLVGRLLRVRAEHVVPRLDGPVTAEARHWGGTGLTVTWTFGTGEALTLMCNPTATPAAGADTTPGDLLCAVPEPAAAVVQTGSLPPWSAVWLLVRGDQ